MKKYTCKICELATHSRIEIRKHMKDKHGILRNIQREIDNEDLER